MLFSDSIMSTLLSEIETVYFGKKVYSRKLFWVVAAINVNAGEVKDTVSPLVKTRKKLSWVLWTSLQKPYLILAPKLRAPKIDKSMSKLL